jgi:Mn-dependent DtxR family transcriptional regulator
MNENEFLQTVKSILNVLSKNPEESLNTMELAEELGMFPSDVEIAAKLMQEFGLVECYMYQEKLWVTVKHHKKEEINKILEKIKYLENRFSVETQKRENHNVMYS